VSSYAEPPRKKAKPPQGGAGGLAANSNDYRYLAESQDPFTYHIETLTESVLERAGNIASDNKLKILQLDILHRIADLAERSRNAMPFSAVEKDSVIRLAGMGLWLAVVQRFL
jgi:hypothetical protein